MEILCGSSGVRSSPSEPDKQLPYHSHEVRFTEKEPDVHNSRVITGERIAAQDLGNESLFLV